MSTHANTDLYAPGKGSGMTKTAIPAQKQSAAAHIQGRLLRILAGAVTRREFISELSDLLKPHFCFDRLCINIYDRQDGMLSYFTIAQGTVMRMQSPLRPAETTTTVAGHVIATQRPVVIPDVSKYFAGTEIHPMEEAGLKATVALPLFLGNEIIGTLHCSFTEAPDDLQQIALFLQEIATAVAPCLGAIFSLEFKRSSPQVPLLASLDQDEAIIHKSRAMKNVIRNVEAIAKYTIPVLLTGETGTGKSMLAQYIHQRSPRKDAHFVKVNCPALSPSLFESELFGHSKGAFTGAYAKRIGRLELAHQGTLFLDEIGDLSLKMQSKLLQVLEDSRFERVGESVSLAVDIRLISATNALVGRSPAANKIRPDLYHRIAAHLIEIPPLRVRKEDIPLYVKAFTTQTSADLGLPVESFDKKHLKILMDYDWPGNLRELRNIVSQMMIFKAVHKEIAAHEVLAMLKPAAGEEKEGRPEHGAKEKRPENTVPPAVAEKPDGRANATGALPSLAELEKRYILDVLESTRWQVSGQKGAAAIVGIPRSTLLHKMKKLGISGR